MELETRIVFTGDISFSRFFTDGWKGDGCLATEVKQYLLSSDYVVANLECPLTNATIQSNRFLVSSLIVAGDIFMPHRASVMSSTRRTDTPARYISISASSTLLSRRQYRSMAEKESKVIFGGRLGEYKYYDMDQVIAAALQATVG